MSWWERCGDRQAAVHPKSSAKTNLDRGFQVLSASGLPPSAKDLQVTSVSISCSAKSMVGQAFNPRALPGRGRRIAVSQG